MFALILMAGLALLEVQAVDSSGFNNMCRGLQSMASGHGVHLEMHDIILSEAGSILKTCLSRTKAMTATRIDRIARRFSARAHTYAGGGRAGQGLRQSPNARGVYPRISVAPGVERTWWLDKNADNKNTFYIMKGGDERRWSNKRWAAYQAMEAERIAYEKELLAQLPKIRGSRGTTKASWVQIADNLGIKITAPGYVLSAVPRNGPRIDGVGRKFQGLDAFWVELENSNKILIGRLNGSVMLQRAVDGRKKYFAKNMEKGAFRDLEKAIKKYPGIFMTGSAQLAFAA